MKHVCRPGHPSHNNHQYNPYLSYSISANPELTIAIFSFCGCWCHLEYLQAVSSRPRYVLIGAEYEYAPLHLSPQSGAPPGCCASLHKKKQKTPINCTQSLGPLFISPRHLLMLCNQHTKQELQVSAMSFDSSCNDSVAPVSHQEHLSRAQENNWAANKFLWNHQS
jgi:hypothetical protein